jgi:hypothetical protein
LEPSSSHWNFSPFFIPNHSLWNSAPFFIPNHPLRNSAPFSSLTIPSGIPHLFHS